MPALKTSYLTIVLLWMTMVVHGQTDSAAITPSLTPSVVRVPQDSTSFLGLSKPKTAAILSAVVPGAGQIYNHKYWKLPIIYGAMGTAVYFAAYNRSQYKLYKKAYLMDADSIPGTSQFYDPGIPLASLLSAERAAADQHRTWMEYSYVAIGAIYMLQIIDATVDAHLADFDVSPDLSLRATPTLLYAQHQPIHGLTLRLTF